MIQDIAISGTVVCGLVILLSRVVIRLWFNEKQRFMQRLSEMSSKSLEYRHFDKVH